MAINPTQGKAGKPLFFSGASLRRTLVVICLFVASTLLSRPMQAQPEEIRVRSRDMETRGMILREENGGIFSPLASTVGDVNGDGYSDIAVFWNPEAESYSYEILYLIYGRADLPSQLDSRTIAQYATRITHAHPERGSFFGSDPLTLPAGDVDGDGFDDFFVCYWASSFGCTPSEDGDGDCSHTLTDRRPGLVYLVYGAASIPKDVELTSTTGVLRTARFFTSRLQDTYLAWDVASGGDLNGDGYSDIVFGAPFSSDDAGQIAAGRVYILFGNKVPLRGLIDLEQIGASHAAMIIEGENTWQSLGTEVAFVGDTDGDGLDDLLIAVTANGPQTLGDHVLLLRGAPAFPPHLTGSELVDQGLALRIMRAGAPNHEARSIARLGDLNGDSLADFAIGSPGENGGRGAVYVVFGQQDFREGSQIDVSSLVPEQAIRFVGSGRPDFGVFEGNGIGVSVVGMDYDSDGVQDLLMGSARVAFEGVQDVGAVYVVKGPYQSGEWSVDSILDRRIEGALVTSDVPEWLGKAVHSAGDVNGDGLEDILVAAPYSGTQPNHVEPGLLPHHSIYLIYGVKDPLALLRVDEFNPPVGSLREATEVTVIGQGFRDDIEVIIGGRQAEVLRVETSAHMVVAAPPGERLGEVDVEFRRRGSTLGKTGGFRYVEPFYPNVDIGQLPDPGRGLVINVGTGRVAVLDHDGDGRGDVAIASGDAVILVYGRATEEIPGYISMGPGGELPEKTAGVLLDSRDQDPYALGDINGDGKEDLALVSDKRVAVILGGNRWQGNRSIDDLVDSGRGFIVPYSGKPRLTVSGNGDFDGDGMADIVFHRGSRGGSSGEVYVMRGRSTWPKFASLSSSEFLVLSAAQEDFFGYSAALVGDVDGDAASELVVGAPGDFWLADGNGFLLYGGGARGTELVENLLASGRGMRIDSVKQRDSLGFTVSRVGDFNGDGAADFVLGALAGSLDFAGQAYVVFGSTELKGSEVLQLSELGDRGLRINGEFGYDAAVDVAPGGDFNGDGKGDLIVSGGSVTDSSNPFPARSYVVFGGEGGVLDLGRIGGRGFRIGSGARSASVGGTDFNGDGFDDAVVRIDDQVFVVFGYGSGATFIRGDSNGNLRVDLSDAVIILNYLFLGTAELKCKDAADANDNGRLELTDAVYILGYLFLGYASPPPPFPTLGIDPTKDELGCKG